MASETPGRQRDRQGVPLATQVMVTATAGTTIREIVAHLVMLDKIDPEATLESAALTGQPTPGSEDGDGWEFTSLAMSFAIRPTPVAQRRPRARKQAP